jgi:hypothetical protein
MAHLGVICLPMSSHMNLFLTLARKLASRGHCITFFGISDNETKVREAGFEFETIESDTLPPGTLGHMMHEMSRSNHFGALRLQGRFDQLLYRAILTKGHAVVQRSSLDGLIVDQRRPAAARWQKVRFALNSERDVSPLPNIMTGDYGANPMDGYRRICFPSKSHDGTASSNHPAGDRKSGLSTSGRANEDHIFHNAGLHGCRGHH